MPAADAERSRAYAASSWRPSTWGLLPGMGTLGLETGGRASVSPGCGPHSRSQHAARECYGDRKQCSRCVAVRWWSPLCWPLRLMGFTLLGSV